MYDGLTMPPAPADPSQTVLVTGGSGYLAGWVIAEVLNEGYSVRTTLRTPSREDEVRESVARISHHTDRLSFATADLTKDEGWAEAAAGCKYVLHVASPFPPEQPKDPDELIVPAREGTLRVLNAALDAGAERIVVTSSVAAIDKPAGERPGRVLTEQDWTDGSSEEFSPYARSKTIAEEAAWARAEERGAKDKLATVNPGAIIGPVINDDHSFSLQLVERMLKGEPAVPKLGFSLVDVRDIAKLQLAAMTDPAAGGNRFIGVARFTWMSEIAKTLRDELGDDARKVPKFTAPNLLIRAMGLFDGSVKSIIPSLGVKTEYSHDHATEVLGWEPRPVPESVLDTARSMLAAGLK
jgi:nucleoside-diphosphate-sugar epimerase